MDVRKAKLEDVERLITKFNRRTTAYRAVNYTLLVINSIIPAISSVLFTGTFGENSTTAGIVISIINMVLNTLERKLKPGLREKEYRKLLMIARGLKYKLLDDDVDPSTVKVSILYTGVGKDGDTSAV